MKFPKKYKLKKPKLKKPKLKLPKRKKRKKSQSKQQKRRIPRIPRVDGRLTRSKEYTALIYFTLGIVFLIVMILQSLRII